MSNPIDLYQIFSVKSKVPLNGKYRGYRPERTVHLIDSNFRAVVVSDCSFSRNEIKRQLLDSDDGKSRGQTFERPMF